jgi:hypothetical protein
MLSEYLRHHVILVLVLSLLLTRHGLLAPVLLSVGVILDRVLSREKPQPQ